MTMTTLMSLPAFSAQSSPYLANQPTNQPTNPLRSLSTVTSRQTQRQGTINKNYLQKFIGCYIFFNHLILGPAMTSLWPHQVIQCMVQERKGMPQLIVGTECQIENVVENLGRTVVPKASPETLRTLLKRLEALKIQANGEIDRKALSEAGVNIIRIEPQ